MVICYSARKQITFIMLCFSVALFIVHLLLILTKTDPALKCKELITIFPLFSCKHEVIIELSKVTVLSNILYLLLVSNHPQ